MTIAFQFAFESHMQDNVACMARQYVRSIISSVQRVALALSPSGIGPHAGLHSPLVSPEAHTLSRWICQSYRYASYHILNLYYSCLLGLIHQVNRVRGNILARGELRLSTFLES